MRDDHRRASTTVPPRRIRTPCSILVEECCAQRLKTRHTTHQILRVVAEERDHIGGRGVQNPGRTNTKSEDVLHLALRITVHRNSCRMHRYQVHDRPRLRPISVRMGALLPPERLTINLIGRDSPPPKVVRRQFRTRVRQQLRECGTLILSLPPIGGNVPHLHRQTGRSVRDLIHQRRNHRLRLVQRRIRRIQVRETEPLVGVVVPIRQSRGNLTEGLRCELESLPIGDDHALPPARCR